MPRIAGVDLPKEKRIEIALTYIVGIGRPTAQKILHQAKVDPNKRTHRLTAEEITRLQKLVEAYPTEGQVREMVRENVQRLKRIGTYRGLRHSQNLPVRGQRTRTNARTKRGKRKTIGAIRKKELAKLKPESEKTK